MKTVLITGAAGFIGRNLCAVLDRDETATVLRFERSNTPEDLASFVKQADFVFHLAGTMRPRDESEFDSDNRSLTEDILKLIDENEKDTPILLTSSIQADLDNPYGHSKKAAEKAVFAWAKKGGHTAYVYRLPNVFGKWSRPNYSSVVATFCYNVAHDITLDIHDPAKKMNFAYIDDVIADFLSAFAGTKQPVDGFCQIIQTYPTTLDDLANKIQLFKRRRADLPADVLESRFDKYLYTTYTSFMAPNTLAFARSADNNQDTLLHIGSTGTVSVMHIAAGKTTTAHYHDSTNERLLLISGTAEVHLRDLYATDQQTYTLQAGTSTILDVPAGAVHSIKNTGDGELIVLRWADSAQSRGHPDEHPVEL